MNQIEAPLVQEFVVQGCDKRLCRAPAPMKTHEPNNVPECQNEYGHEHTSHVSNAYFNLSSRRHESFVWGFDDDGYAFGYTVDLDGLEEQVGRTYTLAEMVAELSSADPPERDAWNL
jgi:hypothetical protein